MDISVFAFGIRNGYRTTIEQIIRWQPVCLLNICGLTLKSGFNYKIFLQAMSHRAYTFTLFVDVVATAVRLSEVVWGSQDTVRSLCFQQEICPDTGRLHLQGFVRYFRTHRLRGAQLALALPSSTHFEPARGSDESNLEYCTRDDKRVDGTEPFRYGNFGSQGKRLDLEGVVNAIREGAFDPTEHLSIVARYPRFISYFEQLLGRPPIAEKEVIYIHGPTGVGKSRFAWERYPNLYPLASCNPEWWDGYFGQPEVLIDEFDVGCFSIRRLNLLLDRYPCQIPVKHDYVWLKAKVIVICSNKRFDEIYIEGIDGVKAVQIAALRRRITRIIHMDSVENLIDLT